ncbi:hypothetical protein SA21337_0115, partial [Staphylococcus aureus subsp. aureus 21337]
MFFTFYKTFFIIIFILLLKNGNFRRYTKCAT